MPGQKVLVVLGAGASYDIWDGVTPKKDKLWRPPLARQLFDFRRKQHFHREIADRYPGVRRLAAELGKFSQGEVVDLEAKLHELAHHRDEKVRRWFRDVPPYLRDLLDRCGRDYVWDPGHYDLLLKRLVLDTEHHVGFVVMNYDVLLEQSLQGVFGRVFGTFDSYLRGGDPRVGPVVKLHGSTNWVVQIGEFRKGETWQQRVDAIGDPHGIQIDWDLNAPPAYLAPAIVGPQAYTHEMRANGHFVYPLLSAPMAGKNPDFHVCPPSHVRALKDFCRDCRKVLVVGSSGVDANLIRLLRDSVPRAGLVHYVGAADVPAAVNRFSAGGALMSSETSKFGAGFGAYLSSTEFKQFLAWNT